MLENRKHVRRLSAESVDILGSEGQRICECTILDVSEGGARLRLTVPVGTAEPIIPPQFTLSLSRQVKIFRKCQMVWRQASEVGVQFVR
jgi:hypothetical protein